MKKPTVFPTDREKEIFDDESLALLDQLRNKLGFGAGAHCCVRNEIWPYFPFRVRQPSRLREGMRSCRLSKGDRPYRINYGLYAMQGSRKRPIVGRGYSYNEALKNIPRQILKECAHTPKTRLVVEIPGVVHKVFVVLEENNAPIYDPYDPKKERRGSPVSDSRGGASSADGCCYG